MCIHIYMSSELPEDQQWVSKSGNPEGVVLDTAEGRGNILTAMHDINR
jgi:hypothetical protein